MEEDPLKQPESVFQLPGRPDLISKRQQMLKPVRFDEEKINLVCEWENCSYETAILNDFMDHVAGHIPGVELSTISETELQESKQMFKVSLVCKWLYCPFISPMSEDLQRHMYLHAYHTKLKCIGSNTSTRSQLNLNKLCRADSKVRNLLPDLSQDLLCAWGNCSERFINIQKYYDHIRYHCEDMRDESASIIACRWIGCSKTVSNVTKLKDHMRSHTQEKLLACPTCGALFSNRTRYFDHCTRQSADREGASDLLACQTCGKQFTTARLLREHERSHETPYRCPQCAMQCASPSALSNHITYKHSTDRPYQCLLCPYKAKMRSDVVKHWKVHDDAELRCDEPGCSYVTKSTTCLENHSAKIHSRTLEPKYICHLCDKEKHVYLKGSYLTKHLVTIHNLHWSSGHSRFKYVKGKDGLFRLKAANDKPNKKNKIAIPIHIQPTYVATIIPKESSTKMET